MSKIKSIDFKGFFKNLLKKLQSDKKLLSIVIVSIVAIVLVFILASVVKPTIRHKQIESVAVIKSQNKQVTTILESEIPEQLKQKGEQVVLIVDASNNPSLDEVNQLIKKNGELKESAWPIYYVQPVYDFPDIAKKYNLTKKNTFIVMEDGKEKGRYAFTELKGGLKTIDEALITLIDPKLEQKKPIRVKAIEEEVDSSLTQSSSERQKTEEIFFEE